MPVLTVADYTNPNWLTQATDLELDVHGGVGIGAIDPPATLQRTDRRHNYRRFMQEPGSSQPTDILGIASFGLTLASRDILFISEVFVPRDLRGEGYGSELLRLIELQVVEEGKSKLLLQSLKSSLGFYAKLGFSIQPRKDEKPFMVKDIS